MRIADVSVGIEYAYRATTHFRPDPVARVLVREKVSGRRVKHLHDWYEALKRVCEPEAPSIDQLLFTLPGAIRAW
ncbi:hypothetical protein J2S43_007972 [Catenuloplanes nepalensis]|uniref:Uncharacterized protein n=1 Tax=Catenuloplanes nepalensis TaxID=587533 RepID=A0ABT9N6Z9_9ACTN|nr:hypothetical protein [Catenuloplanes nepalensis]MDP9799460.1 hypothetical protein [Catenuloplanes nepalensis]